MKISRTGIIVNVEKYSECLSFYQDILNLPTMFQKSQKDFALCCFKFGDSYLILETGGVANTEGKSVENSSIKIRFNVENCESALQYLKNKGINARIEHLIGVQTLTFSTPMVTGLEYAMKRCLLKI